MSRGGAPKQTVIKGQEIQEAIRRIVDLIDPDKIILFGSGARDNAHDESDYDLLIVAPSGESRSRRTIPLYRALLGLMVSIDLIWWTAEEIDEWSEVNTHFITQIHCDGMLIHAEEPGRVLRGVVGKGS